jgi:predicted phosphodiesterase
MRIALIADMHGNMPAFEAVLADATRAGYDQMICLGDVAFGVQPHEALARTRELGCPVIMGNADDRILDPTVPPSVPGPDDWVAEVARWCAAQVTAEDRAFLRSFVPTLMVDLGAGTSLLCYHGSPRSYFDPIFPTTTAAKLTDWFAGTTATVAAGGHTHSQMLRYFDALTIINPGSVGRPYHYDWERKQMQGIFPWAEYAILTADRGAISVDLRRVPSDADQVRRIARASTFPDVERWLAGLG